MRIHGSSALARGFAVASRAVLFEGDFLSDPNHPQYDIAPDGRFVYAAHDGLAGTDLVVINGHGEVGQPR